MKYLKFKETEDGPNPLVVRLGEHSVTGDTVYFISTKHEEVGFSFSSYCVNFWNVGKSENGIHACWFPEFWETVKRIYNMDYEIEEVEK